MWRQTRHRTHVLARARHSCPLKVAERVLIWWKTVNNHVNKCIWYDRLYTEQGSVWTKYIKLFLIINFSTTGKFRAQTCNSQKGPYIYNWIQLMFHRGTSTNCSDENCSNSIFPRRFFLGRYIIICERILFKFSGLLNFVIHKISNKSWSE